MSAHRSPTRRLPRQPHLQQLRKQAKELLEQYRAGDAAAVAEIHAFHPQPGAAGFSLHDAQLVLARAYGYKGWPALKAFVDGANIEHFLQAVNRGDLPGAAALLKARPELVHMDQAADNEHRALHYAVLRRDVAMVRLLLTAGADPHQGIFPHRDATTALALATDREYLEIVAAIEEVDQRPRQSPSHPSAAVSPDALRDAVSLGDSKTIRDLVQADPSVLRRNIDWRRGGLLSLAVRHGHLETVVLLLDLGADVDERTRLEELEEPTESWGGPLWLAAQAGRIDIARLLLDRGADPNGNVYASGWPIDHAYRNHDEALKQLLLDRGARLQPWTVAMAHDVAAAVQMLHADDGEELARELTWSAACNGCPEIVALALPRLTSQATDPRWNWILIQPPRSAGDGGPQQPYFDCMALLLDHGIDPDVSARFGQTALHFTAARGGLSETARVRFANMLLDKGASLALRDDLLQSTPLGWACRWGREELVQLLLARGAKAHERDAAPWATPLAWATKMGHDSIANLLRTETEPRP